MRHLPNQFTHDEMTRTLNRVWDAIEKKQPTNTTTTVKQQQSLTFDPIGTSSTPSSSSSIILSDDLPITEGTASSGISTTASRSDHVHPASVGGSGDLSYAHAQGVAASSWSVSHGLGKHPSVTVVDSSGNTVIGRINYTSLNAFTIDFNATFSGTAYCN